LVNNANRIFKKFSLSGYYFETFSGIEYPEYISSCDVTFLIDVLHHVPQVQQKEFVFKLADKIKPGGRLIVKDIDASSRCVYFNKMHDLIFSREIGNEMSARDVIGLLKEAGLIIEKCKKQRMYVYPHFTIVARKTN
jgi:2-polyprenyl-3-methyl-5-hydroxy-6-metoxy-1,4-benzoquinol methylase